MLVNNYSCWIKFGRNWSLFIHLGGGGGGATENARSFRSNSFFNRTLYQIHAHFRFVSSGHINPSLAFGYNLHKEENRRSLPFSSQIYTPHTVRWSYLTKVYNRMIWRKFYWNSFRIRWIRALFITFLDSSPFVPLNSRKCEAALTHTSVLMERCVDAGLD